MIMTRTRTRTTMMPNLFFSAAAPLLVTFYMHMHAAATVCKPASFSVSDGWAFTATPNGTASFSCKSSAGGTNDLGGLPTACAAAGASASASASGDSAVSLAANSVRIAVQEDKAECLVAYASDCKIPMHDFVSLDYDLHVQGCNGIWAAPLWMTPDKWQWGPGSGEIDSTEFCSRDKIHMNFAGGGHQLSLNASIFNIDKAEGHITVRKDAAGIVTIAACTLEEAKQNQTQLRGNASYQCPIPSYSTCQECMKSTEFSCWCNPPNNIYGSGGCQAGGDCIWTLVSDIWNGVTGDSGYTGCMTGVPGVVQKGKPNLHSQCVLSVEHITVRGSGPHGRIEWGQGMAPRHEQTLRNQGELGLAPQLYIRMEGDSRREPRHIYRKKDLGGEAPVRLP